MELEVGGKGVFGVEWGMAAVVAIKVHSLQSEFGGWFLGGWDIEMKCDSFGDCLLATS